MSKNLIDDLFEASPNRRSFLKKIGIATAAVGALSVAGAAPAEAQTSTEMSVIKFALNLEYLEAEFYSYAVYGTSIANLGLGVNGTANRSNPTSGGTTTGGSKVDFSNNLVFTGDIAAQIGTDERSHVYLLRTALGSDVIAKPNINLNALGFGFGNQNDFLKLARIFEDIGVSAYGGAAGLLTTSSIITFAARILATEAEHAGSIRTQVARLNIPTTPVDGADIIPPPSGTRDHYLSVNPNNGLTAIRTPGQVLYLAYGLQAGVSEGGFFPTGVNGDITMSTAAATVANLS